MFAKTIIDSDAFLEMPVTAQLLYFHLSMRADDDGFINKPKAIMRMCGAKDDDIKILFTKKFIIPFESGVVVIKHWKIHNYIRKDTYTETKYKEEKSLLELDENNSYRIAGVPLLQPRDESVTSPSTQVSVGKDSKGKVSLGEGSVVADTATATDDAKKLKKIEGSLGQGVVFLSDDQIADLLDKLGVEGFDRYVKRLADYIIKKNAHINSHYGTILKWAKEDSAIHRSNNSKPATNSTFDAQEFAEAAIRRTLEGAKT